MKAENIGRMWLVTRMELELRELYWTTAKTIDNISILIEAIRIQNGRIQRREISNLVISLHEVLLKLSVCYEILKENGMPWTMEKFQDILGRIEEAQKAQDDVLLGDYYEMLLLPALEEMQRIIIEMDIPLKKEEWLEANLKVLKERNPVLYDALINFTDEEIREGCEYFVEPSSSGYYTMALGENDRKWYLHSNRNPLDEARAFAKREYRLEQGTYVLVGMGMGYIMRELLALYPEMNLTVVEADLTIIYLALQYGDWTSELKRITLYWDSNWQKLMELIQDDSQLIVFRPEIPHIKEIAVRQQMITIAARQDGIDDLIQEFYHNTQENIRTCDYYVDKLLPQVEGINIVIVAGGPSLDKNLHLLKDRPQNVKVIAVGTVYKLMLKMNIAVDYVIVSDCGIYKQIKGVEDSQIPMLILATADRRVGRCYKGAKYLICQKGYSMAADYAKNNGYQCYAGGGSVSTLALDVAIRLKAATIAFVGLDLAFDGKRSHAAGTDEEVYGGYEYQWVEGTNGNLVNTSLSFISYRTWMERRICEKDVDMPIIDATEGGALKKGFQIMKLKDYLQKCLTEKAID